MRLFVALRLPAEVAAHADRSVAPVRAAHPELRWVPADRWHLTLAFYGDIEDERVGGVVEMVGREVAERGPLELRLAGSGIFERRALWLGVEGGSAGDGGGDMDALRALARAVTFDRSRFRAHVTVARLRGGVDPEPARAALAGYSGPSWVAGSVHLVRSRLGAAPAYDDVASWPLRPRS